MTSTVDAHTELQTQIYIVSGVGLTCLIGLLIFTTSLMVVIRRLHNQIERRTDFLVDLINRQRGSPGAISSPMMRQDEELSKRGFRMFPPLGNPEAKY